jgi:hypothetical protein
MAGQSVLSVARQHPPRSGLAPPNGHAPGTPTAGPDRAARLFTAAERIAPSITHESAAATVRGAIAKTLAAMPS